MQHDQNIFDVLGIGIANGTRFEVEGQKFIVLNCECGSERCTNKTVINITDPEVAKGVQEAIDSEIPAAIAADIFEDYVDEKLAQHVIAKNAGRTVTEQHWFDHLETRKRASVSQVKESVMNAVHNPCADYLYSLDLAVKLGQREQDDYDEVDEAITMLKRRVMAAVDEFAEALGLRKGGLGDILREIIEEMGGEMPEGVRVGVMGGEGLPPELAELFGSLGDDDEIVQ